MQLDDQAQHTLCGTSLLLLSLGHGDLLLLTRPPHGAPTHQPPFFHTTTLFLLPHPSTSLLESNRTTGPCRVVAGPLYPLPCTPPLRTVYPLCLEAAWTSASSLDTPDSFSLCVAAWTLHGGGGDAAPQPPCEVHVFTLCCQLGGADWDVRVQDAARVQTSSLAPFAVAVDLHQQRLALATCPPSTIQEAVHGWGQRAVDHNGVDQDDDGDVDPRTLQEAVQRLAQFTSDTVVPGM